MKVYLISSELNDMILYKIGMTRRDMSKRIKELKTGNAADLTTVNIFESKWASKIEASLKKRYRYSNISGEWFALSDDEVNDFLNTCKSIHDNFDFIHNNNTYIIGRLS